MVLENSSDSTGGDPFNETPPASDGDPYSNSAPQAGAENYRINTSSFPKPIAIIGPLSGYTEQFYGKVLGARLQMHAQMLERPPNQEETEAIAYWTAKQISVYSYGTPVGILAGAWRAHGTSATFRFPFWQPNLEKFSPQAFPSPKMALVKGNNAVLVWQLFRYASYAGVGKFVSQILFGSYSMTISAVGEMGDSRLKAIQEAAKQRGQQKRGGLPGPKMPNTAGSPQSGSGMEGTADDASPTSGMFSEESAGFGENTRSSNDNLQAQPKTNRWPQQSRPAPAPPTPMQKAETQDDSFDPFDDASPTSHQGARTDTRAQQPQRQQGSAWDRVRQNSSRAPAGRQTESKQPQEQSRGWSGLREQAERPTASDEYAFSKSDDERSLVVKVETQKEFDARVERERKGGDFSGNGDQRRW